jgi:penicillin-binding protein 1A
LPVEVWTRFMKAAHQGVAVAALPGSQTGGLFSTVAQATSQSSAAATTPPPAAVAGRPPSTRASVRPEAASGLDGWLMDRLFGR